MSCLRSRVVAPFKRCPPCVGEPRESDDLRQQCGVVHPGRNAVKSAHAKFMGHHNVLLDGGGDSLGRVCGPQTTRPATQ
jgi:hypothetical protein